MMGFLPGRSLLPDHLVGGLTGRALLCLSCSSLLAARFAVTSALSPQRVYATPF